MMSGILRLLAFIALAALSLGGAEGAPPGGRPKIGLALSGGGARGLSHIGVIRWLEERRIPIDYIAGTSMGGLVGGAYAAGMDSGELQELVEGIDWGVVLRGAPAYEELDFRRKQDQSDYPSSFEFGLRKGFRLPTGLNPGHETGVLFDRIALPYAGVSSFDLLPTPFRCVATDLVSGGEVVLREGNLATALRATMAIPAIFSPVLIDGMVLVDGGLVNNMPVDVLKKMGADVVIAVDAGNPPLKREDLDTLLGLADRAITVMVRQNVVRNAKHAKVVLEPDPEGVGTLDFEEPERIIAAGYKTAAEAAGSLLVYAVEEEAWEEHLRRREGRVLPRKFSPKFVNVAGEVGTDQQRLQRTLRNIEGRPLDENALKAELTEVTGWGRYEAASYTKTSRNEEEGLGVTLRQKEHGPPFLKPIIKINGGQTGEMTFEIAARMTLYDVLHGNNEWRSDASVGRLNLIGTELYQKLGSGGWFVAPRAYARHETQFLFRGGDRISDYGVADVAAGIDSGYNFGRGGEFRGGYQYGYQKGNVRAGESALPTIDGAASDLHAVWRTDRLNSSMVATRGFGVEAGGRWLLDAPGAESRLKQVSAKVQLAFPIAEKWTTQLNFRGGGTFDGDAGPIQQYRLGGPTRLGALGLDELRGNHFVYSSAGVLRLLHESPGGFIERTFAGGWYETGDAFDHNVQMFHGGTFGVMSETRFGALFIGAAIGEGGRGRLYFSLGRFF